MKKFFAGILVAVVVFATMSALTVVAESGKESADIWDGSVDQSFDGKGTLKQPYLITSAEELAGLVTLGKAKTTGKYYKLVKNVDISAGQWYLSKNDGETNTFNGTFDGNGCTVSGMNYYEGSGRWGTGAGLFPAIDVGAHIKNVGIINANIDRWGDQNAVGSIFGFAKLTNAWDKDGGGDNSLNYPTIEHCYADESVSLKGHFAGGIGGVVISAWPGQGYLRIANCYFIGKFIACNNEGNGSIGNIYNATALVHNFYTTSSFKGTSNANIKYFHSYSSISNETNDQGGIYLTDDQMKGNLAKEYMVGFDFENDWNVVENGYPSLRLIVQVIGHSVSFDLSEVEGTEYLDEMYSVDNKVTLPDAPDGYHWMHGKDVVFGTINVTQDITVKAEAHTGGTATCKQKAKCEICDIEYGEVLKVHGKTVLQNNSEPSCSEEGYTGDMVCEICYSVLQEGKEIPKTKHHFVDGECTECGNSETGNEKIINADIDPNDYLSDISPEKPEKGDEGNFEIIPSTGQIEPLGLLAIIMLFSMINILLFFICNKLDGKTKNKN